MGTVYEKAGPAASRLRCYFSALSLTAFALRLLIISTGVEVSPDGKQYIRIAENLIHHKCYSTSDPAAGLCEPTWSNQPPGYPFFIGSVSLVFHSLSPTIIVVLQTAAFCAALYYVLWAAARLKIPTRYLIVAGTIVALSPVTVGWSRWVLTETLSAAAGLLVLAECLNVLTLNRISTLRFCIAIGLCALMRWDMIWVAIPFMAVAIVLCGLRKAVPKIAAVGALAAIPYVAAIVRAVVVGLPLLPSPYPPIDEIPPGIQSFWKKTAVTQNATAALMWPVWDRRYSRVLPRFRPDAFLVRGDAHRPFHVLVATADGAPVSKEVDESFRTTVAGEYGEGYLRSGKLLLLRTYHMWCDRDDLSRNGYWSVPGEALLTLAGDIHRFAVLLLAVCCFVRIRRGPARALLGGILLMIAARTLHLASLTALEIRYLSSCFPPLEFAAVAVWGLESARRGRWPKGSPPSSKGWGSADQ